MEILFIIIFGTVIFGAVIFIIKTMLWFVTEVNVKPKPILAVKVPSYISAESISKMENKFKKSQMGRDYHILSYVDEVKLLNGDLLNKISQHEDRKENNSSGR